MSEKSSPKKPNKTVLLISKTVDITNKGSHLLIKKSLVFWLLFCSFVLGALLGFVLFKLIYIGV